MEVVFGLQQTAVELKRDYVYHPQLPLAVYREIAAHLNSLEHVSIGLIEQDSGEFDYDQSQLKGLWIEYPTNLAVESQQRLEEILVYYAQKYGGWQDNHQQVK